MTEIVTPAEAAEALREGEVALVPTETVVGLVAAEAGLSRIREIKGRDADKPVALLCASPRDAFALAASVPPLARTLAAAYWPGPLTLVLDRPGGGTVGVRVPADSAVRAVLAAYGGAALRDERQPLRRARPRWAGRGGCASIRSGGPGCRGRAGDRRSLGRRGSLGWTDAAPARCRGVDGGGVGAPRASVEIRV